MSKNKKIYVKHGCLVFVMYILFKNIQKITPRNIFTPRQLHQEEINNLPEIKRKREYRKRTKKVEIYVIIWLIIEIILYPILIILLKPNDTVIKILFTIFISFRIFDIFQANLNINIFANLNSKNKIFAESQIRLLLLALINYLELILCFGLIYYIYYENLFGFNYWYVSIYFSAITQFTIGYGDIYPLGFLKIFVILQALFSILFTVLILARFITFLPKLYFLSDESKIKNSKFL